MVVVEVAVAVERQLLVPAWAAAAVVEAVVEAAGERPQRPAQPYLGILVGAAGGEEEEAVGWYPSQRASPAVEGEEAVRRRLA